MTRGTTRIRLISVFVLFGLILGAVIGVSKGEGIGGIVIEAVTSGFIAGAVTLATSTGRKPRGRDAGD